MRPRLRTLSLHAVCDLHRTSTLRPTHDCANSPQGLATEPYVTASTRLGSRASPPPYGVNSDVKETVPPIPRPTPASPPIVNLASFMPMSLWRKYPPWRTPPHRRARRPYRRPPSREAPMQAFPSAGADATPHSAVARGDLRTYCWKARPAAVHGDTRTNGSVVDPSSCAGLRPEKWCTDSHLIRVFGPASE